MYIVRWLKGHPLISIWVLGFIAILLTWSGSSNSKKAASEGHQVEIHSQQSSEPVYNGPHDSTSQHKAVEGNALDNAGSSVQNEGIVSLQGENDSGLLAGTEGTNSQGVLANAEKQAAKAAVNLIKEDQVEEEVASKAASIKSSGSTQVSKGAVADLDASSKEDMLVIAREAYWNNGLDEAAQIYQRLIKLEPDVLDHKGELGNVYWRQGYPKKAAKLYSEIAIPMINDGKTEAVANMIGFIGLFYPDRAAQINDHLQAKVK